MHATIHGERTLTDLDSILAITDFSASTDAVLSRAAQLAAEHGATLKLMYAAPGGDLPCPDAACRLSHHALQLGQRHEIGIRTVSRTSNTDEDVASAARCADLVVAGVSRERSLLSFLRGQPVDRFLRAARRDVPADRFDRRAPQPQLLGNPAWRPRAPGHRPADARGG